ncbi:MAG: DUF4914 domain-containing protein [Spirochaetes bacterium GWF1_51_8]|nr:MAG: DUF4914 domain-containing protein [Spirochaetes bacterium GWF1_51_8]
MKSLNDFAGKLVLNPEVAGFAGSCKNLSIAENVAELYELSVPEADLKGYFTVKYDLPSKRVVEEAYVCKVKNGISVNYFDPYMRRRDPETMLIGDARPTDKARYSDKFGKNFVGLREETFAWLAAQDLIAVPFISGHDSCGIPSLAFMPRNAAFFGYGLALLQGMTVLSEYEGKFEPKVFVYVAPPFRHTHFSGKQIVVHNRQDNQYEIFSYNLYPGPSAKKGVYGALLHFGEIEGWGTNHASLVQVITPYDLKVNIMHEGASGGGKSEMNEHLHREFDGSLLFGRNTVTDETKYIVLPKGCNISPVTDDMAMCPPAIQKGNGKLTALDAENGWFIRVDHIKNYGTDPDIESRAIHPNNPLLFLNIDAQPGSTALLWEHIEDAPGKTCPNPRIVIPRQCVPSIVNKPISVDIRSFGVRTPPCTAEKPSYGILGLFHILPPAIAWIWRLVSPRGFDNPSIISTEGMGSEGAGSYWPFATGLKVNHANILLKQITENPRVHYSLSPVKHVGAWEVGFMPQWIMREYISRRGGIRFTRDELSPSRSILLGYSMNRLVVESQAFDLGLLQVEHQAEVGVKAFDEGDKILTDFFKKELAGYNKENLDPLGKRIIDCFVHGGSAEELEGMIEAETVFLDD